MPGRKKKKSKARSAKKKKVAPAGRKGKPARSDRSAVQPGMPAKDSIVEEIPVTSPKGNVFRIIRTNEVDEYEEPPPKPKKDKDQ